MSSPPLSKQERALREELLRQRLRSVAILSELRALGVVDVSLSENWHLENFLRFNPEEHRAADLAVHVGVDLNSVRTHLASLARNGKIRRVRFGVYAALPTAGTSHATKGLRGAQEAPTDALRARIADLLYRSRKPLPVGELLKRSKFPPKSAALFVAYLATLAREGHIKRVNTGVYATNTPPRSPPPPLSREVLHQLVARSKRAMTTKEIFDAANVPQHGQARALMWLRELVVERLVRRVRKGVYAPLDETKTAPLPPTLMEGLRAAIEKSERAMTTDEILRAAKVPSHQLTSASVMMSRLVKLGLVRRVQPGIYAPLHVAELALPPPRRPLLHQLREAVEHGGRAMTVAEILAVVGVPDERRLSATSMLSGLVQRGLVRRVHTGVYAPLHAAAAVEPSSMEASILAALAKHPEGLDVAMLCARVRADDEELDEALRALLRDKRVRRVRLGVYVATA